MAIELNFKKPDSSSQWGFRLVGGADYNEPLVVVKVNENSFAEGAGLMVGDVVVRVNQTPTAGLTHAEAHDLINKAGYDFVMAVRRGLFSDIPVPSEEDNSVEIENILKRSLAKHLEDIEKEDGIGSQPTNLENLAGQEQLIDASKETSISSNTVKKPKKWSTFLVKPKNPKPVPKKLEEGRKIIGEPYRVKIVKQPRRDPNDVLHHKKTVKFEPQVTEVEISRESSIADSTESLEIPDNEMEMEIDTSVKISEETIVEIRDADDGDRDNNFHALEQESSEEDAETSQKPKSILKPAPIDIHIDPVICESSLSLEEQLAAVQKQLLALSQLPSAIQVTLEAVTQQLNKIFMEKSTQKEETSSQQLVEHSEENLNYSEAAAADEENNEENASLSENAEGDITENEAEDQHNFEELDYDQEPNDEDATTGKDEKGELQEVQQTEEPVEIDPYAGLTEEEKEAKIREEQMMAKKQKIEEERRKMDWTQRPIVLPGGRKWSDPDDAAVKPRAPKMSDEKICKTIEEYSEVIVGKVKGSTTGTKFGRGEIKKNPSTVPESQIASWFPVKSEAESINFLKYQPPPKNLDYLQKSEVYRLIHDMEPPVRGVGARAEKILSENDYYGDKGAP